MDKKMAERTAEEIMNKEVITITRDRSILELAELFIKNKISGVPVVDKGNTLQGIVSESDVVNFIRKNNTFLPIFIVFVSDLRSGYFIHYYLIAISVNPNNSSILKSFSNLLTSLFLSSSKA